MSSRVSRVMWSSVALSALLSLTNVQAEEPAASVRTQTVEELASLLSLRGDYGFTFTQSCARTPFMPAGVRGIDPITKRLLVPAEQFVAVSVGTLSFAGDGIAKLDAKLSELSNVTLDAGQVPVTSPMLYTCKGPFSVKGSKLAVTLNCNVTDVPPGLTVTLGPLNFEGFAGPGKQSLTLSTIGNEIQVATVKSGDTLLQQRDRICLQSATLDKIR
jgi:hypothetical protein